MHLRLDDINTTGFGVTAPPILANIVQRDKRSEHRIENALGGFFAIVKQYRVTGHKMADVAYQQQTAPGQHQLVAVYPDIAPILIQAPGNLLPALVKGVNKIAFHQAEPVTIGGALVGPIDCGDRILTILNRRQRRFQNNILDMRGVITAYRVININLNFNM